MANTALRSQIAEYASLPLRVRARTLAEGLYAGTHRATTKGSGIEFAGHRPYTPGDDLRYLDRHARLRHDRLLVRQFQTDTERSVHLVCDVSSSMAYSDVDSTALSKLDLALLMTASLAYLVRQAGDDLGVTLISEEETHTLFAGASGSSIDHIMAALETQQRPTLRGDDPIPASVGATERQHQVEQIWNRAFDYLGSKLKRGAIVIVLSDFLDLSEAMTRGIAHLMTRSRTVRAGQILSKAEATFPFDGVMRFYDPESHAVVQADAQKAKPYYEQALAALTAPLEERLRNGGGRFTRILTGAPAEESLRELTKHLQGDAGQWG